MHGSPRNQSLDDDNICIACEDTKLVLTGFNAQTMIAAPSGTTIPVCGGLGECLSKKQIHFCQTCRWICPKCTISSYPKLTSQLQEKNDQATKMVETMVAKCIPAIVNACAENLLKQQEMGN